MKDVMEMQGEEGCDVHNAHIYKSIMFSCVVVVERTETHNKSVLRSKHSRWWLYLFIAPLHFHRYIGEEDAGGKKLLVGLWQNPPVLRKGIRGIGVKLAYQRLEIVTASNKEPRK